LADLVASGWRADEAEAKRIAVELLGVLEYLATRRPPVAHRCASAPEGCSEGVDHGITEMLMPTATKERCSGAA